MILTPYRIANSGGQRCQATLTFVSREAVKPITFNFAPITCSGLKIAEFDIPPTSPVGDAYVIWWVEIFIPDL